MTRHARAMRAAVVVGAMVPAVADAQLPLAPLFVVTDTSVRQGRFEAVATSRQEILSTYPRAAREVRFRFSINGLENEFPGGTEHTIYLRPTGGRLTTRVYRFGDETEPPPPTPEESSSSEEGVGQVTFRVDLRHVRAAIASAGRWVPALGEPVTRIERVYVLGDPAPLTWDYGALRAGTPAELTDADADGIYEGTVPIATEYTRPASPRGGGMWRQQATLDAYPTLESRQRLQDAIYRLSLEELGQLVRPDGAFSAGAKWEGVWTRDISLAAILSTALVAPDATRKSLMAKVDSSGRIIQDTGTGGSWPVSTDRMVWALAAWELYAVTGDRDWLRRTYDIVQRSARADLHAAWNEDVGLFNGESSFMDWREQSYPRWMQPADIHQSQSLSTNVVHYAAYRVIGNMARALGEPAAPWDAVAERLREGINRHFWQPAWGWFGAYRYGRSYPITSPRSEGLGAALAIVYGAAAPEQRPYFGRREPMMRFGAPSFWPFTEGERFYHNATVWPFVTAFATWAAADAGGTHTVQHGLDNATRTTALFLTNKENTVAATGHYEGTALNSDRQLWSVAGTLAGTYRVLLGMRLEHDRLSFRPMVPPSYTGVRTLRGFAYRGAVLDVTVRGHGDSVISASVDGRPVPRAEVLATTTGRHTVDITMNGRWPYGSVSLVDPRFAPATPVARIADGVLTWHRVPRAEEYDVYRNGTRIATWERMRGTEAYHVFGGLKRDTATALRMDAPALDGLTEYQVMAIGDLGVESFLSEPVRVVPPGAESLVRPTRVALETQHAGFTGDGYVRLTRDANVRVVLRVKVARAGTYAIDARYANGNGPVNTEDKAAVRTLLVDRDTAGVLVMPQRGVGRWTEWGWSSALHVRLSKGTHTLTLVYTDADENMNRRENTALLDHLRVTRLAAPPGAVRKSPR